MSSNKKREELPLDARLLSDAIIEINISRRNVAIYPKGHHIVENSLSRAFNYLKKLFELRKEISLKVAKDILIIDDYYLDKKNSVYKEFALCLSRMNIACVTFNNGMNKEELYTFQKFVSQDVKNLSPEIIQEKFKKCNLLHFDIKFIDYGAFSFDVGKNSGSAPEEHLWERYVHGLVGGTLSAEEQFQVIEKIPPEILAKLINETDPANLTQDSYETIVVNYLKTSSKRIFSGQDIKKLTNFINELRPDLKKHFLSSSVRTFSKDMGSAEKLLRSTPIDEIVELLDTINAQKIAIPDAITNLLQKLSKLEPAGSKNFSCEDGLVADDIPLSNVTMNMLSADKFNHFVNNDYSNEIKALLQFDSSTLSIENTTDFLNECREEQLELDFNKLLLELISFDEYNILTREDYEYYDVLLPDQIEYFIGTGQYEQVMRIYKSIKLNAYENKLPKTSFHIQSPKIAYQLVDSFRDVGRLKREEAINLSQYLGGVIIQPLIDALVEEQSLFIRKFLLDLIIHQGNKAVPEAIRYLNDSRWYVQRNMLIILSKCGSKEAIPSVRKYCYHSNAKVSFQAIRYLLQAEDSWGVKALKHYLGSKEQDKFKKAIVLSGTYRVREVVPVLIDLLNKNAKSKLDFSGKMLIVKSLGQIGDARGIDTLRNFLSSKSLLFQGPLAKLKKEISQILKKYTHEDMKEVIEGRKSH